MKRRQFLGLAGGALAGIAFDADAQQAQSVAVITPSETQWESRIFREALAEQGYREGANLSIDVFSAENELDRLPRLAAEAVSRAPHVILAVNTPGTQAAMAATTSIPIVSAAVADPVFLGIVKNMARPEANVTGVANMATDITSKRVALLKEAVPSARRFALFAHPDEPVVKLQIDDLDQSAPALGIEHRTFPMRNMEELQKGLQLAVDWQADAVVRLAGQAFALGAATGRLASERRLPSMMTQRSDVEAGGLMSYFADPREIWRRVAVSVARLLKGAKPQDLPVERPTRFELFVNLATARKLGISVSPSLLARADDVIE